RESVCASIALFKQKENKLKHTQRENAFLIKGFTFIRLIFLFLCGKGTHIYWINGNTSVVFICKMGKSIKKAPAISCECFGGPCWA
ncbi:MAG: hypothetical protein IKR66_06615, partial [Bacteroidales bacterium]|nr:hypothetical protein [Bacteroidales bacterium]